MSVENENFPTLSFQNLGYFTTALNKIVFCFRINFNDKYKYLKVIIITICLKTGAWNYNIESLWL